MRSIFCFCTLLLVPDVAASVEVEKFLPKETDVIVSVNIRQILDSELVKTHALELIKSSISGSKDAQEAIKVMGLDPLTDINRLSFGMGIEDIGNPRASLVIEGKFNIKKIQDEMETLAKNDPKQYGVEKVGGKTLYRIAPSNQSPFYIALLDSATIVTTTQKEQAATAFDAVQGTTAIAVRKEVLDLLKKADANASLFLVAHSKGKLQNLPLIDNEMKRVLNQIQTLTVEVRVTRDASLGITLVTGTLDEAKSMAMLIAGGLDLAKVQVKVAVTQQPELQPISDLVNSMAAEQKEKTITVTGKVSGESLGKLLKK